MPAYISEVTYLGGVSADFIEVAVETGTDMSGYSIYVYSENGLNAFGPQLLGSVQSTNSGKDVYVIDKSNPDSTALSEGDAIALVDDLGNVVQFISFDAHVCSAQVGPAAGMDSTDVGTHKFGGSLQSDDDGATYYTQTSANKGTVPCYATGTLIDTPGGPRAVEDLQVGDLVETLDHGPQPIRWTSSRDYPLEEVDVDAKPVLIAAGALGKGLPTQDLIVSPQHRMFVGSHGQLDGWFRTEGFAPAKTLTVVKGIRHMKGKQTITWIHFACDRHEVVMANGCLSETLLLGPMVVNGLTRLDRRALTAICGAAPTPDAALNGPAARECLKVGEVRRHLAKCKKEKRRATAKEIKKWNIDFAMEQWEADRLELTLSKSQKPDLRLVSGGSSF